MSLESAEFTLSRRVLEARVGAGFSSPDALAKAVGIKSGETIRLLEVGESKNPTLKVLGSIADATGRSLDWLTGRDAERSTSDPVDDVQSALARIKEARRAMDEAAKKLAEAEADLEVALGYQMKPNDATAILSKPATRGRRRKDG